MTRIWLLGLALLACTAGAFGQAAEPLTIETTGSATIDTMPTYVEFWLHKQTEGDSLAESVAAAQRFGSAVAAELEARQLTPELTLSGIALPDVNLNFARTSAKLRFSLTTINNSDDAPQQFAALCQRVLELAATLECEARGPHLGTDEVDAVTRAAISLAAEDAYPSAECAAGLMNAALVAVQKFVVEEVVWNEAPEDKAHQPDLDRLTCTVKVRLTYSYGVN